MASLDATGVNVAMHHIGQEFGASVSALQWALTGYLLALASLILLVAHWVTWQSPGTVETPLR